MSDYPELDRIAMQIANKTTVEINKKTRNVRSAMPYKAQHVLEMVIRILEARV